MLCWSVQAARDLAGYWTRETRSKVTAARNRLVRVPAETRFDSAHLPTTLSVCARRIVCRVRNSIIYHVIPESWQGNRVLAPNMRRSFRIQLWSKMGGSSVPTKLTSYNSFPKLFSNCYFKTKVGISDFVCTAFL